MKSSLHNTRYFVFAVFALLLSICSCHRAPSEADRLLDCVDSLCYTDPDSAVALVSKVPDSTVGTWPEATRMRYHLMHIKALDKAYLDITGDTLMPTVLSYYKSRNDRRFLPEAYFYAGRFCADIGDAPQAMEYYAQALALSNEDTKIRLRSVIHSQMGVVCASQDLWEEATIHAREAFLCDSIVNDTANIIADLRDLAEYYALMERFDSALVFINQAEHLATENQTEGMLDRVLVAKGSVLYQMNHCEQALAVLQSVIPRLDSLLRPIALFPLTYLYQVVGKLDSAEYCSKQLLAEGDSYQKSVAYKRLGEIALKQRQTALADSMLNLHLQTNEVLRNETQSMAIERVQQVYNYQIQVQKVNQLNLANEKHQAQLAVFLSILLVLSILMVIVCFLFQSTRQKSKIQAARFRRYNEERQRKSEDYLRQKENRIHELETMLNSCKHPSSRDKEQVEEEQRRIQAEIRLVTTANALHQASQIVLLQTEVFQTIKKKMKEGGTLTQELRDELECVFTRHCSRLCDLLDGLKANPMERCVCFLLILGFHTREIGRLVCRQDSTIATIRSRLYKKYFGRPGSAKEWDDFILSL